MYQLRYIALIRTYIARTHGYTHQKETAMEMVMEKEITMEMMKAMEIVTVTAMEIVMETVMVKESHRAP